MTSSIFARLSPPIASHGRLPERHGQDLSLMEKVGLSGLLLNLEQNSRKMSAKLLRGLPPDFWLEYIRDNVPLRSDSLALFICTEVLGNLVVQLACLCSPCIASRTSSRGCYSSLRQSMPWLLPIKLRLERSEAGRDAQTKTQRTYF